jgi:tRNA threonylcarbamoyladenosine dehydratase
MIFSRNLGLITAEQQSKLKSSSVLICGVGGMGGVCAEVLVRMGVGKIRLIDPDHFEESNFNRQIHSNRNTVGKFKVNVLEEQFRLVNPDLQIDVFPEKVSLENVKAILKDMHYVVNGMDELYPSICVEREARRLKIPIIDAWLTPFASVFTMKEDDPHWEEFLGFPTKNKKENEITEEDCKESLKKEVEYTLSHSNPFKYVDQQLVGEVLSGKKKRPSLAPVVWLSGVFMANEVFKMIAGYSPVGPAGIFYDQYTHQIIPGKLKSSSH